MRRSTKAGGRGPTKRSSADGIANRKTRNALLQARKHCGIDRSHQTRRAQIADGMRTEYVVGFPVMTLGQFGQTAAHRIDHRMRDDVRRCVDLDRGAVQKFAWQIKTPHLRVFIEIAQDVGELKCATKLMRECKTW